MTNILNLLTEHGITWAFVGGCVRDEIMGIEPKDIDVEVFGFTDCDFQDFLCDNDIPYSNVGENFGVFLLRDGIEISLPRVDVSAGRKPEVKVLPEASFKEAQRRRDFTMNALSKLPDGTIIDNFGGLEDIENGILEIVDEETFGWDWLRVLRAFQFIARFGFRPSRRLLRVAREASYDLESLPVDRVYLEWWKFATKGTHLGKALEFLRLTNWISFFPPLFLLKGLEQTEEHHPEGDVWEHTKHVADACARICEREGITGKRRFELVMASICHDFGKIFTTEWDEERQRWTAFGHDKEAKLCIQAFLECVVSNAYNTGMIERVNSLVSEHMVHIQVNERPTRLVRRLSNRLVDGVTISDLAVIVEADHSGRPPLPARLPEGFAKILEVARDLELEASKPKPILMGRHLLEFGVRPGRAMGEILNKAFDAQLDGEFDSLGGAIAWWTANR